MQKEFPGRGGSLRNCLSRTRQADSPNVSVCEEQVSLNVGVALAGLVQVTDRISSSIPLTNQKKNILQLIGIIVLTFYEVRFWCIRKSSIFLVSIRLFYFRFLQSCNQKYSNRNCNNKVFFSGLYISAWVNEIPHFQSAWHHDLFSSFSKTIEWTRMDWKYQHNNRNRSNKTIRKCHLNMFETFSKYLEYLKNHNQMKHDKANIFLMNHDWSLAIRDFCRNPESDIIPHRCTLKANNLNEVKKFKISPKAF